MRERLRGPWPEGPCLWLHGASLGECKMLLNLAFCLIEDLAHCPPILLTTQKAEVLAYLNGLNAGERISFGIAPLDVPTVMRKFVARVKPLALVLGENELWPGYLKTMAHLRGRASVALVSGRYRSSAIRADFDMLLLASMQTAGDLGRFCRRGLKRNLDERLIAERVFVGGNWKLLPWCRLGVPYPDKERMVDVVLLSLHFAEWKRLRTLFERTSKSVRTVVLVPRRLEELDDFCLALKCAGHDVCVWPETRPGSVSVVDCYGKVPEILDVSKIAIVGGSFCKRPGIHDFWEPLRHNVRTLVGPYANGSEEQVDDLVCRGLLERLDSKAAIENLDLLGDCRDKDLKLNFESQMAIEKKKILDSYQRLLLALEDLL